MTTQNRPIAKGMVSRGGMIAVVVRLDPETFEQVRARAVDEKTSFAEQARTLIEWGLDA